jgi:hypothetical protein
MAVLKEESGLIGPKPLWVPRQPLLQALDRVGDQQCRDREEKNAASVARPMLLGALVDSAEFVDGNFEGPHKAVHERTLALKTLFMYSPRGLVSASNTRK